MMSVRDFLRLSAMICLLSFSAAAAAQMHEQASGPYVLRATVSTTGAIAAESARIHGVEPKADRAILNVIVVSKDDPLERPLRAEVTAHVTDLAGVRQEIELSEIEVNNRLSYTGTFGFLPREVLEFEVSAQPEGSAETLELAFSQELWMDG